MSSSEDDMPHEGERAEAYQDSDDAVSSRHNSDDEGQGAVPPISYVPSDSDEEIEKEREAARLKALSDQKKSQEGPLKQLDSDDSDVPSERQNSDAEMPSEDDEPQKKEPSSTAADHKQIFGDLSDSDDDSDKEEKKREFTEDDIVGPRLYPEPEAEETVEEVPDEMNVVTNKTQADLGKEPPLFVKFPNFLSVETKPFTVDYYEDEADEEETLDEEGRQRLKLKVENTIRWRRRMDKDGNEIRESNAKMVKWSDGTMSLYLGSEIFEVNTQPMHEHNHLFIRQGAGLQGLGVFKKRAVFRPHSTETLTHRKMTLNMAERSNKSQKVKVLNIVGNNPEEAKRDMIRKEEEKLRAAARRETQQRKMKDRQRASGLTSGFLESGTGYDSDEGESLGAIKNRYKGRPEAPLLGQSSDEESDPGSRLDKAKLDSDEDSSDVEARERGKQSTKRKIVSDDESD